MSTSHGFLNNTFGLTGTQGKPLCYEAAQSAEYCVENPIVCCVLLTSLALMLNLGKSQLGTN